MAIITIDKLALMASVAPNDNMRSVHVSLEKFARRFELEFPHRLAHYLPQIMHESGAFRYDREVWGPTPAQKRYEGRKDLGNTEPGDGERFKGRTGLQATGRYNYRKFTAWCRAEGFNPPDFEANPEAINTDPWEGLFPIYYWAVGNPTGRSLNPLADENNIEQITKRINGGLNGFDDRIAKYVRCSLVLNDFGPLDVENFQIEAKRQGLYDGEIDGDPGPKTRTALHMRLSKRLTVTSAPKPAVRPAPVTEVVTEEVAVVPKGVEKRKGLWFNSLIAFASANGATFLTTDLMTKVLLIGVAALGIGLVIWRGEVIARRVKAVLAELGD